METQHFWMFFVIAIVAGISVGLLMGGTDMDVTGQAFSIPGISTAQETAAEYVPAATGAPAGAVAFEVEGEDIGIKTTGTNDAGIYSIGKYGIYAQGLSEYVKSADYETATTQTRCSCDKDGATEDCPSTFVAADTGSTCYDYYGMPTKARRFDRTSASVAGHFEGNVEIEGILTEEGCMAGWTKTGGMCWIAKTGGSSTSWQTALMDCIDYARGSELASVTDYNYLFKKDAISKTKTYLAKDFCSIGVGDISSSTIATVSWGGTFQKNTYIAKCIATNVPIGYGSSDWVCVMK